MQGHRPVRRWKAGEKAKQRLTWLAVAVFLIPLMGFAGGMTFLWLKDTAQRAFVKTEIAQEGRIEEMQPVRGWLVRDEKALLAPVTGRVEWVVPEGERVRLGALVAKIQAVGTKGEPMGPVVQLYAPRTGLVYYSTDGLEDVFNINTVREITPAKLKERAADLKTVTQGTLVEKGTPVFKVINNIDRSYLLVEKNPELDNLLALGNNVRIRYESGETVNGRVVKPQGDYHLLQVYQFVGAMAKEREISFQVVEKSYQGLILPKEALVFKDELAGIYVTDKREVRWKQVEVIGEAEGKVAVKGIGEGTEVVITPSLTQEGEKIN